MRQETINIYTIEDHPEPDLCYDWIRNNWHDLGQHCVEDVIESLKVLAEKIDGKLDYSISINPDRGEFIRITDYDEHALKDIYLKRDDCPLTGVCYDFDVIYGLYHSELETKVLRMIHKEGEHIYSDEGLKETCIANEYEFNSNGSVI